MSQDLAADAAGLLNDLVGDLATSTNMLRQAHVQVDRGQISAEQMVGIQKMCLSHLVIACTKLVEIYDRYNRIIPDESRSEIKKLVAEFNRRGIASFRNKVVGHIWDNNHGRPWRLSEIMAALDTMAGGNVISFLDWANNPKDNSYPVTIFSVVEHARDALMSQFGLSPDDVINR
jgi:hypothetical protein